MGFVFIPFYIRFLGMESYGLIGFFGAMLATFAVLDLGMGLTINRELARVSACEGAIADARVLLRTFEAIYWVIAVLIGGTFYVLAPLIAEQWLQVRSLSSLEVERAIRLMGAVAMFRWPVSLYTGAMQGMQQQIRLNVIAASGATLAGGGAVLALEFYSADIQTFFVWQVIAAAVLVMVLRRAAWRTIPLVDHHPAVTFGVLRATLAFSGGLTMVAVLSVILSQLDKIILSRLLPLSDFGYYMLAGSVASVLITAGATIESATFPELARLQAAGSIRKLSILYHRSSQVLALMVVPLASALTMFAPELLSFYIKNRDVVEHTHLLLSLLVIGNGTLALMFMPLSLQLSYGWTSLALYKNIVAVLLFVPALYVVVPRFGAAGAACLWIAVTMGYLLVEVQVMHRRLLPGEQWRWYGIVIGIPLLVSLLVLGGLRVLLPAHLSPIMQLLTIGTAGAVAIGGSAIGQPSSRQAMVAFWRRRSWA